MKKKGFTLIELLVVIAIIGLLSTLAVVSLGAARGKARDAKRISDVKAIQTAMEMYKSDHNDNATITTSDLAPYIQGGFPTPPTSGTNYNVCSGGTSTYIIAITLEQTPSSAGSFIGTANYSTDECSEEKTPICNTTTGFCVGTNK